MIILAPYKSDHGTFERIGGVPNGDVLVLSICPSVVSQGISQTSTGEDQMRVWC